MTRELDEPAEASYVRQIRTGGTARLLARNTFPGGSTAYSWLLAGLGAGAVAGGLLAARYARTEVFAGDGLCLLR
jgi:hypothetical protein